MWCWQKTPFTFDVSVWELFWPLQVGARLVVAVPDGHRDPRYLTSVIVGEGVTTVHFVPSMLEVFVTDSSVAACVSLTRVFASGEALPASVVADVWAVLPGVGVHNLYGPTEAAGGCDVPRGLCRRMFWGCRSVLRYGIRRCLFWTLD